MNPPLKKQPPNKPQQSALTELLKTTGMWRASNIDHQFRPGISTGYPLLDRHLPGAGWPTGGLTELLYNNPGIGEFRLLIPTLAQLSQQQNRWLLMVAPPYIPYAPALAKAGIDLSKLLIINPPTAADTLWAMEKALASKSCAAVLALSLIHI
ncbi:MAG: hypothetical protein KUG79_10400 [Pseudomonadales bacterium]|nr:hypothetical protein [Pseudomonadales bacterium]